MQQSATDRALVERIRARDPGAVADLSNLYGARIHQLAFRCLRNREDAEEVAQDVLLKVYRNIDAFRGDAALSSWIYRITFNAAMSRLRANRAARTVDVPAPADANEPAAARVDAADWSAMADEGVFRNQMLKRLRRALLELPVIYRTPVVLRDVLGFSTEEASRMLKVKDQTLKSRLHRGRLFLRERLADFSSGLALHQPA